MKDVQSKSEDELTSKYVVGLELKPEETIAFFSPLAFHAGPTSLSLVLNSFLQCVDSDLSANFEAHAIVSDTRVCTLKVKLKKLSSDNKRSIYCCVGDTKVLPPSGSESGHKTRNDVCTNTGIRILCVYFSVYLPASGGADHPGKNVHLAPPCNSAAVLCIATLFCTLVEKPST